MPFKPTATTGIHALDAVQQLAANQQYSWTSGCAVSLSSATTIIETELTAGTVVFDGETISIGNVTVEHTDGDLDHPRWDAVCVTDNTGTVEAISGIPAEPVLDQNGVPVRGHEAFKPAPSDNVTDEMVCLAIVWIPSGATTNSDLSDTSAGGVPNPVVDRRVYQQGQVTHTTRRTVINSSGWYRIAAVGNLSPSGLGGRADGLITIRDTQTGLHSSTTVNASCLFSDHALTLLNSAAFVEPHGAVDGVRIVSGTTNDGAAVDVNVQLHGQTQVDYIEFTLQNNLFPDGWEPVEWESATVPTGYETSTIDFTQRNHMLGAVGRAGERNSFSVDHDGVVSATNINREHVGTRLALTTDQTIQSQTQTTVSLNTVLFDDRSQSNGSGGIVVEDAGTYDLSGALRLLDIPSGSDGTVYLVVNGGNNAAVYHADMPSSVSFSESVAAQLSAGDTVTLETNVNVAGGTSVTAFGNPLYSYLSVTKLG